MDGRATPPFHAGLATRLAVLGWVALAPAFSGCQGSGGPLTRWRLGRDDMIAKPPTDAEVGDDRNPLARLIRPKSPPSNAADTSGSVVLGSNGWSPLRAPAPDPDAESAFRAAEEQFQQGQFGEAETAFARLAKRKKGTSWGEKAQFYLAETQFQRGELVSAHDSYEKLFTDYPGTQFLDRAVNREFAIAQHWMNSIAPGAEPEQKMSPAGWWQGRHPAIDVSGHALAVLEHVRHHDPTGPLADDAVMRIADFHYANQNYEEAAIYYDQLITDHPKSDLLQKAQLASVDAKVKSYLGPDYDGAGLEQARELITQSMATFPERKASHSDELYKTMALIDDQMAERAYHVGEHYLWTGKVTSAEYCFGKIPVKWPKSPWASKAKEQLAKIASMPRKETKASTIMTLPGSPDGASMGGGGGGGFQTGMGGAGPGGMGGAGGMGGMGGP